MTGERVITGSWDGVPISRPKTAAEQLVETLNLKRMDDIEEKEEDRDLSHEAAEGRELEEEMHLDLGRDVPSNE